MHLLATQPGVIADGTSAVDLAQTPGDIVVLSSADTELALLAAAQQRRRAQDPAAPTLRLAPIGRLAHNLSVDLYMETVATARLVVARILGGSGYWRYGVERLGEICRADKIPLALLPGDDKPDRELAEFSTAQPQALRRLWRYLVEGGPGNAENFLRYAGTLFGRAADWAEPAPLLRAGLYWPDCPLPSLDEIAARWRGEGGVVPILFYRALVQSGNTAPVDALVQAIAARRLRPLPVFVQSLKDAEAGSLLDELLAAAPPAVILNATGFSVRAGAAADPLAAADCPVLQVVFSGGDEESWRDGTRGLNPRDLAMNVALPEIDGRILTRAVSFKAPLGRDPETEADLVGYRPVADRIAFVADLARNWARLRQKPAAERRVALVLANYPNRDGRIGNGVGLDTPASAIAIFRALAAAGYRIGDAPDDPRELIERLLAGPTNAKPAAPAEETLSFADYSAFFATLPPPVQRAVAERWGAAERDPFFREGRLDCGRFAIPGFRAGNIAVLIQPARGYNIDPKSTYHDPALVPPHGYLAAYAWLAQEFRADAVIHLGKHGTLEWLPGKALALSAECWPEAAMPPLPHLYPFIVNDPGEGTQAKRRAQAVIVDHLTPPLTRAGSYGALAELERLIDEYYEAARGDAAPRRAARRGDPRAGACRRARRRLRHRRRRRPGDGVAQARRILVRAEGIADSRRASCVRAKPRGRAARRAPRRPRQTGPRRRSRRRLAAARAGRGSRSRLRPAGPRPRRALDRPAPANPGRGHAPSPTLPRKRGRKARGAGGWRLADGGRYGRAAGGAGAASRFRGHPTEGGLAPNPHRARLDRACAAPGGDALRRGRDCRAAGGSRRAAASRPALRAHRAAAGPRCCRPDATFSRSIFGRCRPRPLGSSAGNRRRCWSSAMPRNTAPIPERMALSAWGTANMRTGGDDIAQALALMGVRPVWERASGRVTGFEILPAAVLDRPRVDVTLRVSGFFRDAFPGLIDLFDSAARAVAALDEPAGVNPLAARFTADRHTLEARGTAPEEAARRAGYRVFGAKPGSYGAGLQTLIDERIWDQ